MGETRNDGWGMYDGQCAGCDLWGHINDLGLCMDCADKIERDLIREHDWDRSASAFGLSADDQKLRQQVIREYGQTLELIEPSRRAGKNRRRRARQKNHPQPPTRV